MQIGDVTIDPDILAAIAAVVLSIIGLFGIVLPVLPGSITIAVGFLIWAIVSGTVGGWVFFGIAAVLLLIGNISGAVLTGRGLKQREIPTRSVTIAILVGIVGMFVLPAFGLLIGFVVGLVGAEYYRVRDWGDAVDSSLAALKALGIGMLIEMGCALASVLLLAVAIVCHFMWWNAN